MLLYPYLKKRGDVTVQCLKCGVDIPEGQVFCDSCREAMAQYPVRSNVLIQLPPSRTYGKRPPVKRGPSDAERIHRLRMQKMRMGIVIAVLSAIIVAGGVLAWFHLKQDQKPVTGQNYTVTTPATEAAVPSESTK